MFRTAYEFSYLLTFRLYVSQMLESVEKILSGKIVCCNFYIWGYAVV